ncbi:hypothetical protein [Burkholderia sp. BCC1998]|nr:hypothetical protein [Burkholderia sp. BCC1998]
MPPITDTLIAAIAKLDPLSMAVFFVGATGLAAIWLAASVVKHIARDKTK